MFEKTIQRIFEREMVRKNPDLLVRDRLVENARGAIQESQVRE
jgi:hypothetical protein